MEGKYISRVQLIDKLDKNSYLNKLPAIKYLTEHDYLPIESDVTFLVGENATGKSTLLEAIAVAFGFNAEGGTKNFNFTTNATHSQLHEHIRLSKSAYAKDGFFLRAESFYNVSSNIDELDSQLARRTAKLIHSYGGKSLHKQSHGESFLALVQNRFGGNGLYILDEPEAALSPQRQLTLLAEIDRLVKANSQLIIATHSPILMCYPNAQIYQLSETGIESVTYDQTEHFQLTKRFLNNPQQMLNYLLD